MAEEEPEEQPTPTKRPPVVHKRRMLIDGDQAEHFAQQLVRRPWSR